MDPITTAFDLLSIAVLVFMLYAGYRTLRAFKQSKQAVTESASLLGVIVNALTSRMETSELLVADLQGSLNGVSRRSVAFEDEQSHLRADYLQVLEYLQEVLLNDKRLIVELEQLKSSLTTIRQKETATERVPEQGGTIPLSMPSGDVLAALTPTERHTLEILAREGPKAAPELGRRMRKSREHMARLMKKLYLEGYVDRETNRAPFRYKLTEKIEALLKPDQKSVTVEASEKA